MKIVSKMKILEIPSFLLNIIVNGKKGLYVFYTVLVAESFQHLSIHFMAAFPGEDQRATLIYGAFSDATLTGQPDMCT